jgi:predicted Na+-dependent transporter
MEMLTITIKLIILIFLVSTMFRVGSSLTLRQILGPLRDYRLLISSLVASHVLVPFMAVVISRLCSLCAQDFNHFHLRGRRAKTIA